MSAVQNDRLSERLLNEFASKQSLIYGSLTLPSSLSTCGWRAHQPAVRATAKPPREDILSGSPRTIISITR
jgi:hypothetical protein